MKRVKRGVRLREIAEQVSAHPVLKAILLVIDGPDLLWHIYEQAEKRCGQNKYLLRYYFKKLLKLGLIRCLTPELKGTQPGRIYALANKGIEIKKILCQKQRIEFNHIRLRGIDWYEYGRVILGQQRIALLKILDSSYSQRLSEIVEKTKGAFHYKTRDKTLGIAIQNVNNTLRWLIKEKLIMSEKFPGEKKRHKPITKYRLTEKGDLFKRQMTASG